MEINRLQRMELDMFKEIVKVCKKLDIRYYAWGGTLLGTIRHKGFIPWDDDIDISMKRDDYEKFIREAGKYLPEHLKIVTFMDSEDDAVYTARVVNTKTKIIIKSANIPREDKVWIDLWALDGMPKSKPRIVLHKLHLLFLRMMVQLSVYDKLVHQYRRKRPWYERAIMFMCEKFHLSARIDTKKAKARVERCMKKYKVRKDCEVVNFWGVYKFKEMVPYSWVGRGHYADFEDTQIRVPDKPEKILEHQYGDYMKLPPENVRWQQHCMEIVSIDE